MSDEELELWRAAFEATADGLLVTNREGRAVACNRRFRELFGLRDGMPFDEALLLILGQVVDSEEFLAVAQEIQDNPELDYTHALELKDGRTLERFSAAQRVDGRIVGRVYSFTDVTARRRSERARRESEQRLRSMVDHVEIGLVELEETGLFLSVNPKATRILGYSEDELKTRTIVDVTHADDRARTQAALRRFTSEEIESHVYEARFVRRDGWVIWAQVTGANVADEKAGAKRRLLVLEDISARKRVEDALRRAEVELTELIENMPIGVFLVRQGRLVYANTAFARSLGWARADLAGVRLEALLHPDDVEAVRAMLQGAEQASGDVRMLRKDRRIVMTAFQAGAEIVFHGEGARIAIARDVTEQSRIEAQLLLADRMASVGRLAAGIAHEINNPLSFVLSNLEFVQQEIAALEHAGQRSAAFPEIQSALTDARAGADRVRVIVRDVRAFSRADDDLRGPVDLHAVLDSVLRMVDRGLRQRATVTRDFGPVPPVLGSESRLGQVFLNLVVNALEAMSDVPSTAVNEVRLVTRTDASGRAVVEVRDTGPGIAPDVVDRIFDPFFTTKPIGKGTGLGLSVSYGIVTAIGGTIEVESELGRGTLFRVLLVPAAPALPARESPAPAKSPRGRVLVIDDEPLVGVAVRRLLAPDHEVTSVTTGKDAFALLDAGKTYDLLMCDLILPDLDGAAIFAELERNHPEAAKRVVFATGGAFTPSAAAFLESTDRKTLEKPVSKADLEEVLREALARRA